MDWVKFKLPTFTEYNGSKGDVLINQMLEDIVAYSTHWKSKQLYDFEGSLEEKRNSYEQDLKLKFIQHINTGEGIGTQNVDDTKHVLQHQNVNIDNNSVELPEAKIVTINIGNAYDFLARLLTSNATTTSSSETENEPLPKYSKYQLTGVIEEGHVIKGTHKLLMSKLGKKNIGGKYSLNKKCAKRQNEKVHYYREFYSEKDMSDEIQKLVDIVNTMTDKVKEESNEKMRWEMLFKVASCFFYQFLEIHPFGDGNGRLTRLLCSYILNILTPFPTPVYNIYCESTRDDYLEVVEEAQDKDDPSRLTAMIIECNWKGWQQFLMKMGIPFEENASQIVNTQ